MNGGDERARPIRWAWLLTAVVLFGCGEEAAAPVALSPPPDRSAAQDSALRRMALDVVEAQSCALLEDRFVPLPEDVRPDRPADEVPLTVGRLWVDTCRAEQTEERALSLHLSGRGWQWVDRAAEGPLGSTFTLRGNVRMEASVDVVLEPDLGYDEEAHRFVATLTPTRDPSARVTAIGELPVVAEGGWSGLVGGLGSLLGSSPDAQASATFSREGSDMVRRELANGATLLVNLCSGQPDLVMHPLDDGEAGPPRPYDDGRFFYDNGRGMLAGDGLEIAGPYPGDDGVAVDLEIESGVALHVSLVCRAAAETVAAAYLAGQAVTVSEPAAAARVPPGEPVTLTAAAGACEETFLLARPVDHDAGETRFRSRVRPAEEPSQGLVDCGD